MCPYISFNRCQRKLSAADKFSCNVKIYKDFEVLMAMIV
jgi:hypothetical protein